MDEYFINQAFTRVFLFKISKSFFEFGLFDENPCTNPFVPIRGSAALGLKTFSVFFDGAGFLKKRFSKEAAHFETPAKGWIEGRLKPSGKLKVC